MIDIHILTTNQLKEIKMTKTLTTNRNWAFMTLLSMIAVALPDAAFAASGLDIFSDKLCEIVAIATGQAGKAIATLGIVFLGIGAFFGKLNWGLAVLVAVGIIAIFGAAELATGLGGDATCT